MNDVTQILSEIDAGNPNAVDRLLPLVYDELRRLAAQMLAQEKPGQTLQATSLVHEAYLRLLGPAGVSIDWNCRGHFFAAAAEAMRRILIEAARHKKSLKAGGDQKRVPLIDIEPAVEGPRFDLLALDEALSRLEAKDRRKAEVVKLRFFAGLTNAQTAETLGISTATAENEWAYAKTWLRVAMNSDSG